MVINMACKYQIGEEVHSGRFHGIITGYTRNKGYQLRCRYKCCQCGYEGEKLEYLIAKGSGCRVCANKEVLSGYNDIATTDLWMLKFFVNPEDAKLYTHNSMKKLYFKCPDCGRKSTKAITINNLYVRKHIPCICQDSISIPNKFIWAIAEFLIKTHQIQKYEREFSFLGCSKYRYDMYFLMNDNTGLIVEMDGGLGHGHAQRYLDTKLDVDYTKQIDEIKDNNAARHGIKVIRIDATSSQYDYLIHQIKLSELSTIFDFTNINWKEICEKSSTNLIKTVCLYKKEHPEAFTTDAAKEFHLDRTTIADYWKRGTQLGWCSYDGKNEARRKNMGGIIGKRYCPVQVITPDGGKHEYISMKDLQRKSQKQYGFTMWETIIKRVCIGEKSDYHKYQINFIDKESKEWQDNLKQQKQ